VIRLVLVLVLAGAGFAGGWVLHDRTVDPVTTTVTDVRTTTQTVTTTAETAAAGLPAEVERTRAAIHEAAKARDFVALAKLIPDAFRYTFGDPFEGGAIAYWQNLEPKDDPFGTLARITELPYTLTQGYYVWPFAYDKTPDELGEYGRQILGDLKDAYVGDSYYGWRAGIAPDGTWQYYVRGD
jgi:hypothetical protein